MLAILISLVSIALSLFVILRVRRLSREMDRIEAWQRTALQHIEDRERRCRSDQ